MGTKKSDFTASTSVADTSTFDFVINGENKKITKADLLAALGVTGTISQVGAVTGTAVLDVSGTPDFLIRNIEAGDGITIGVSPNNGVSIAVTSSVLGVGTLQQVTTTGNTTNLGIELIAGSDTTLKAVDGHTRGLGAVGPTNVVVINSLADFPAPSGGVIELVPVSGDPVTYLIGALNIDVSPNVFSITSGSVVIRGTHRTASRLTTSATGTMFTASESEFFQEYVAFDCPNAKWLDFAATDPFLSMANQNVILLDCTSIATIAGAFTTSLRTMTVVSTSVGGILWAGALGSQINMSNFLGLSWTGALLDLGTATFNQINIVGNNRFISPSGATSLSGLTANGNFNDASGRGEIEGNIFNGLGTALVGVGPNDTQWNFLGNSGIHDSHVDADTELTTQAVTISVQSTYYAVAGSSWTSDISNRFTVDTAGVMTYDGIDDIDVLVIATSTLEKSGGGSDLICSKLAIDTGSGFAVIDKTVGCTQSASPTQVTSQGIFPMSSGDAIQLFVANTGSTSNITVTDASVSLVSV